MGLKIITAAAALAASFMLVGCKQDEAPAGPKSMADVAKEAAGLPRPLPGLYRSTVNLLSIEAPGLAPPMVERMKGMMAKRAQGTQYCLTAQEAGKGYEESVKKLAGRPNCAFDRYSASGGQLDAQLTCKADKGMTSVLTLKGVMSPNGSDVTMTMDQSGAQMAGQPGGGMKMKMQVKSERVGDCPG